MSGPTYMSKINFVFDLLEIIHFGLSPLNGDRYRRKGLSRLVLEKELSWDSVATRYRSKML